MVAQWNSNDREDWNLGGHAVVADALAGWIRDDAWVVREEIMRAWFYFGILAFWAMKRS